MKNPKATIQVIEERTDKVKIRFPHVDIPIEVSHRYFNKLKKSDRYIFKYKEELEHV